MTDAMRTESPRAPLLEVFASIQGEGRYAGEAQVFLRLAGCPLRCRYCDTPESWPVPAVPSRDAAETEAPAGWVTPFGAACRIAEAEPGRQRTVSVTGGEPLLWPAFLAELPGFLGPRRLHLETAGAHPAALERVIDCFDHISLDLKAPDDLDRPVQVELDGGSSEALPHTAADWAGARTACLSLVVGRDACAKLVVTGGTRTAAYTELLDDILQHAPELPVFIQPATPMRRVRAPEASELEAVLEAALERELPVRVVPQVHRLLGVR